MKAIFLLTLSAATAMAHHGQDFFLSLDARVPAQSGFAAFATAAAGEHDFSIETGLIAGLGANFAAGFSVDFSDSGSFQPNGIAPILQWSAPLGESPLRIGAAFSYHFHDSSRDSSGGETHSHGGHSHGGHSHARFSSREIPTDQFAFSFNPDAPPPPDPVPVTAAASTGSSTIHLHDEDYFLARIILEYELTQFTRVVGNFIIAGTSSSDTAIGYALAVRQTISPRWAAGIEAMGDFNTGGYHQVVIGIIHSPRHDFGLRLGISHGLGAAREGAACLIGTTWRF